MTVTIYSTPACVQCNQTKRVMDSLGIAYQEIDLSQHPEIAADFRERGYLSAPIVEAGQQTWSGFKLERIKGLKLTEGSKHGSH